VLTGETGAGKSIVADALALLLGGRADAEWVRAGADSARIEGIFAPGNAEALARALSDSGIEPAAELILSREIAATGRSTARINARAVPVNTLAEVGRLLADIHGQNDYLSLLRSGEQLRYLDRFTAAAEDLADVAELAASLRRLRAECDALQGDERERARLLDRLDFEIGEINEAQLAPGEEEELRLERDRLSHAEQLATAAGEAYDALSGGEGRSAADQLGVAAGILATAGQFDEALGERAATVEELAEQARDLARELRAYRDGIEFNPARLALLEERLDLIARLKRKYGSSVDDVLAYGRRQEDERARIGSAAERLAEIGALEASTREKFGALCGRLSLKRRDAANRLSAAVEDELRGLGLPHARFAIRFASHVDSDGVVAPGTPVQEIGSGDWEAPAEDGPWAFESSGIDRVDFLVSLNAGEPLRPLAKVASGGETARIILALKTILGAADETSILVFDEVDTGLGGRSGRIIGEKLARLGRHHQVLCITHLPQIACFADRHIMVSKRVDGGRSTVEATPLDDDARETELAAMLGGITPATRASARELLAGAAAFKGGAALSRSA
jgi:DNA repair protein RecN (Recombination protein N)